MKGLIYTFTNKENGLVYVGQTIQEFEVRYYAHIYQALRTKVHNKFYNAIRKYGKESFITEIIHVVESDDINYIIDELNRLEIIEIHNHDSLKNGYNSQDGGRGKIDYVKRGKTIGEAKMNSEYKNSNIIEQYDLKGNLVNTFGSTMQAQRATGANNGHILKVCRGQRKTHKGYIWKFGHIKSGELQEHLEGKDTAAI